MYIRSLVLIALVFLTVACAERRKGPMERAGERVDEISDNVREGEPALKHKGPLEKAGEAVDDTLSDRRDR